MKGFLFLAASILLASCSCSDNTRREPAVVYDNDYPQQVTTVPAGGTTVINSGSDHDHSSSLINGMILGHMMSNSGGGYRSTEPVSKRKTIINKTYNTYHAPAPTRPSYSRQTSTYRPSPMRTRTSMSSRSMGRRGR